MWLMKVNLLTDAPKHNLALMRISAYHKAQGDDVKLNGKISPSERRNLALLAEELGVRAMLAWREGRKLEIQEVKDATD